MTQFQDMPIQLEVKIKCTDMENEPEEKPASMAADVTAERKAPKAEALKEPAKAAPRKEEPKAEIAKAEASVPAEKDSDSKLGMIILVIVILLILAYIAVAFLQYDGDFMFIEKLINK